MVELLGPNVLSVGRTSFEQCFRSVANRQCDYALLPVENTLGGSIHENYDLMLRYDLSIVAEHELRVSHCLISHESTSKDKIKFVMSHPQALAQCDGYLRANGLKGIPMYDTAGSAKMISDKFYGKDNENGGMPEGCTVANTAAIASDLAARTYQGMTLMDSAIEDDDCNFTRFLLLSRSGVAQLLNKKIPSKTSVVFTLPNSPGALYKALACFSLREIDFSKIESRPTSAHLLQFLKFSNPQQLKNQKNLDDQRFRYCFYLDILAAEFDEGTQNAIHHLKEQAQFCRILGSYPAKSRLIGPVKTSVEQLADRVKTEGGGPGGRTIIVADNEKENEFENDKLKIGIIGFGKFGQFLASMFKQQGHEVLGMDKHDRSSAAEMGGVEFYSNFDCNEFMRKVDVVVFATPVLDFKESVTSIGSTNFKNKLVVDVCSIKSHPKDVLKRHLPTDCDLICTHPMFDDAVNSSPLSNRKEDKERHLKEHLAGLPFVYEKIRLNNNVDRALKFLDIFAEFRCKMVELGCEQHDKLCLNSQFITHLTGRLLGEQGLRSSPIDSAGFEGLLKNVEDAEGESFDVFYGLFKFNGEASGKSLGNIRDALSKIERKLAAKEAFLIAKSEIQGNERERLISQCRELLSESQAKK